MYKWSLREESLTGVLVTSLWTLSKAFSEHKKHVFCRLRNPAEPWTRASDCNLSVCLSVCLSACLSVWLSVCLSVCLSICLSGLFGRVCNFVCLFVCLSVCLSVCVGVCLLVCESFYKLFEDPFRSCPWWMCLGQWSLIEALAKSNGSASEVLVKSETSLSEVYMKLWRRSRDV